MKALAFSGGKDSMAVLHLCRDELDCGIYVDTGFSYPETLKLVEYAAKLIPMHVVKSNRKAQNAAEGIPADVVAVNWTRYGHAFTGKKDVMVQSYFACCAANIMEPLWTKAMELGVTQLYIGQRNEESHKAPSKSGERVFGVTRVHPIEDWTEEEVFKYLAEKMEVPPHFRIKHSSLDCYDCTAYSDHSKDRVEWTKEKHPQFYEAYSLRKAALERTLHA